jgi:formate/nitrite transporter
MTRDMPDSHPDDYRPAEIARRVSDAGVAKAKLPLPDLLALAVLAGAFISLGAAFSTVAVTGSGLPWGLTRVLAGLTFCLGLVLVVVAGAELFTGNVLIAMAWASREVSTPALLRNWAVSWTGNLAGALLTAGLVRLSRSWTFNASAVGASAVRIAAAKAQLPFADAFFLGILCNALVCLAVWLTFSARSTADRILAVIFPVTAFVALGFEHSIANMYYLPMGMLLKGDPGVLAALGSARDAAEALTWGNAARNLLSVTLGNMLGGGVLVAAVYWFVYLRKKA